MAAIKTFTSILYLLLYGCFCTADISPDQVTQVDSGMTLSKEFLQGLNDVANALTESKKVTDTIQKVLKVFDAFGKVAASFGFIGALLSFIFAFIPQEDPLLNFMKEQFAEVNRKLDSISLQISTLQTEMEWTDYASTYSEDENAIRNSWAKLKEFLDGASKASTKERKTRLAEMFTSFYENTGTENSVANLHRYITENSPVSLNKNLLKLVIEKSNGNFNVLVHYSAFYTSLMVSGLQLNLFYYKLKGYDTEAKAEEAVTQLTDVLASIRDALIECVDDFEEWARRDVMKFTTERFSNTKTLSSDIKNHLESKFHWFRWIVIAHSNNAENEFTFGKSFSLPVQEKAVVHVIYQEKSPSVDQKMKDEIKSGIQKELKRDFDDTSILSCLTRKEDLLKNFDAQVISQIWFLHAVIKPSDYVQTDDADIELTCEKMQPFYNRHYNIYLKRQVTAETTACSIITCIHGKCKFTKDTTQAFCVCDRMFTGPSCEQNIRTLIDFMAIESKIDNIIYQPVPGLTTIYFSVKDLKEYTKEIIESVRHDIQWTQVYVKYSNTIQKFSYINTLHNRLKMGKITESYYTSEVAAHFTGGNTFTFFLTDFNHMMMGTGFGDNDNILDIFRKSLDQNLKTQSGDPLHCSKDYRDQIDYFVRYMFALEKEAVLAWSKYLLIIKKKSDADFVEASFKDFVSDQWKLYNKNGCGKLQTTELLNKYCEESYHSTRQQKVTLKCQGNYTVFPETVTCSGGEWSDLPVCYSVPVNGQVKCQNEQGTTVCRATCLPGWVFTSRSANYVYKCFKPPCAPFKPLQCNRCTANSVCKDNEVCDKGTCQDTCPIKPCGINAQCIASDHKRTCTCVSPWKGDPYSGCKKQDLQWIETSLVPNNTVLSIMRYAVCKALAPDGKVLGMGYVTSKDCNYEWGWKSHKSKIFQVMVDPCEGRGYKWVEGSHKNMYRYGESRDFPGVQLYICCGENGLVGTAFKTRNGFKCHIADSKKQRHDSFYTLIPQPCI